MEPTFKKQYLKIHKDKEPHLIVTTSIMGKIYRGVLIDSVFWFLVEDLIPLRENSQDKLTLITKLLHNISDKYKDFINVVDARGNIREVLTVSTEGLRDKLFN